MRLSHRDFDTLQRAILEIHAYRDIEEFWQAVPHIFLKVIPADHFLMNGFHIDPATRRTTMVEVRESVPRVTQEMKLQMESGILEHPFASYFMGTGDPTALKLSDFFSGAQLRNSPMYQEFYRRWEIELILSVGVSSRISDVAAMNLVRRGKDFTERDRLMMNLLKPHVDLACSNAERATSSRASDARRLADYALSARETEAARWLAQGKTNPEIAIILGASVRTVEKHVAKIIEKIGVENRTSAALTMANSGWKF
jgi:DNA-binding CsgD family transcriptional regulator